MAKFESRIGDLLDVLHEHAAVTSGARNGRRYGARFCVTAENPVSAVGEALRVFREAAERVGLPPWPVVEVQLQTMAELERQNRLPTLPENGGCLRGRGAARRHAPARIRSRPQSELSPPGCGAQVGPDLGPCRCRPLHRDLGSSTGTLTRRGPPGGEREIRVIGRATWVLSGL